MLTYRRIIPGVTDLIQSLGKVSDLWLDPRHPLRVETIQALQVSTGFGPRQIEMALTNCFEELRESHIRILGARHQGPFHSVLHVLPANVFTSWVHGAVISLLLGLRCLLKPSMREPVFAFAWKKSIQEVNPELSSRIDILTWDEAKKTAIQAVVAYGSDETLRAIRGLFPKEIRFAGFGHKLSVGILFKEALSEASSADLLEQIRLAAEPFQLRGCLSPQILYVEKPDSSLEGKLRSIVNPAPRVKPFAVWSDVRAELAKIKPHLSCVGFAGNAERDNFLERELAEHEGIRICPIGKMQRPPLSWKNGGIDLPNLLDFEA